MRESAGAGDGLVPRGHLRRRVDVEIALFHELGDDVVEELRELLGALPIILAVAAQRLEHLGGELSAFHEGVEDRLAERIHRAILLLPHVVPVRTLHFAAGEAGLQEKIRELVEERLEVDGVGHLGAELAVRVKAQRSGRL